MYSNIGARRENRQSLPAGFLSLSRGVHSPAERTHDTLDAIRHSCHITASVLSQKYDEELRDLVFVIPAKAGIHDRASSATPPLDARLRGHDDCLLTRIIFIELTTRDTSSNPKLTCWSIVDSLQSRVGFPQVWQRHLVELTTMNVGSVGNVVEKGKGVIIQRVA